MPESPAPKPEKQDGVTVLALGPRYESVDEHVLDEIREATLEAARTADPPRLVIDLSHTNFFGSAFIEILFRAYNRLNERPDGRFAISGLTQYCAEIIQVTHLDRLWSVYGTREEAVAALKNG
ncbi:MAG: STAS domain-containing protein [Planctomycetes bacterium]|nr:STAS domain-containing protein [Planctomycetota bacterium]